MLCSESTSWSGGSVAERLERWTCNPEAPRRVPPRPLLIGNLTTRRSWYHRRQPEVFLQHDTHCAWQAVLELRSRSSKREFSGWNQRFKFCVLPKSIRHTKVEILRLKSCFLRMKENLTQIFERHFQLNYSVGVRDGFTLYCLMICIWPANRVPDPVLRGQPCRSWIKNVSCLSSEIPIIINDRIL